ncbi:MAG: beta-aspartyl-peptidase [Candidatus Aerophobetes bacterium]|nr:beta-aspartyl-peptidase [Candidatus Aerophobetes bacterium]
MKSIFKLIRGGRVYNPQDQGVRDVLIAGDTIVKIAESIEPPKGFEVTVFNASNMIVIPGFIDLHVHLIGGGGEAGPVSRVPEITLSNITEAGITTVVGVLGTDDVSRYPETLLAKIKALRAEGISAFMYTGSYHIPSPTITGSVKRDIALINEVIGVKIAISDHRASQPTTEELSRIASEARVGGMLGRKAGIVHLHVGSGSQGLTPLIEVIEQTEIPISQFLPTHISRAPSLLRQGIEFVKKGGYIDITAPSDSLRWKSDITSIMKEILKSGVNLKNITMSSDGNGSMPEFDERGQLIGLSTGKVSSLSKTLRTLVGSDIIPLSDALKLITSNPADRLGISDKKGQIRKGGDADIVILDKDLKINQVYARGRLMVDKDKAVIKGAFE